MIDLSIQGPDKTPIGSPVQASKKTSEAQGGEASFGEVLKESISEVNRLQEEADGAVQSLASVQTTNLHETMIALEKADISFRLMMQVRNKILDAYQEIMRTQL